MDSDKHPDQERKDRQVDEQGTLHRRLFLRRAIQYGAIGAGGVFLVNDVSGGELVYPLTPTSPEEVAIDPCVQCDCVQKCGEGDCSPQDCVDSCDCTCGCSCNCGCNCSEGCDSCGDCTGNCEQPTCTCSCTCPCRCICICSSCGACGGDPAASTTVKDQQKTALLTPQRDANRDAMKDQGKESLVNLEKASKKGQATANTKETQRFNDDDSNRSNTIGGTSEADTETAQTQQTTNVATESGKRGYPLPSRNP